MIQRLLCALSFHKLKTIEQVKTVDVLRCENCKRTWAVETERQQVYELPNRQDVFSIQDEAR